MALPWAQATEIYCDDSNLLGVKSISLSSFDKMLSISIQGTPGYPKIDDVISFRLHYILNPYNTTNFFIVMPLLWVSKSLVLASFDLCSYFIREGKKYRDWRLILYDIRYL